LQVLVVMLGDPDQREVLDALRNYVVLDADVSDALEALGRRENGSLSAVLHEARDLAVRLAPEGDRRLPSQLDLEGWLSAVLRGPHDEGWFDKHVHSHPRGWSDLPALTCILLIGRVRHRITAIAAATPLELKPGRERIADAIARLFDMEVALVHFNRRVTTASAPPRSEDDPPSSLSKETSARLFNALGVIETSAYLIGRYSAQVAPGNANIERHLERISKHVQWTNSEIMRLIGVQRLGGSQLRN
jgi:hypothetical protein